MSGGTEQSLDEQARGHDYQVRLRTICHIVDLALAAEGHGALNLTPETAAELRNQQESRQLSAEEIRALNQLFEVEHARGLIGALELVEFDLEASGGSAELWDIGSRFTSEHNPVWTRRLGYALLLEAVLASPGALERMAQALHDRLLAP